jgi:hypothetical protein
VILKEETLCPTFEFTVSIIVFLDPDFIILASILAGL